VKASTSGTANLNDTTGKVVKHQTQISSKSNRNDQDQAGAIIEKSDSKRTPEVDLMLGLNPPNQPTVSTSFTELEQFMPTDYQISNDQLITTHTLETIDIYPKVGNSAPGAAKDFSSLRFVVHTDSILSTKPVAHDLLGWAVAATMAEHPLAHTWKPSIGKLNNNSRDVIQESMTKFVRETSSNSSHILTVSHANTPNTPLTISAPSKRAPESPVDNESQAKQARDHDSLIGLTDEEQFDFDLY
jgi:hypothetical protein